MSGTASLIEGTRHVRLKNNARGQAIAAMEESVHAVEALGGQAGDVVRVRAFLAVWLSKAFPRSPFLP